MLFADVIIDISHEKVDRTFQYIIPENLFEVLKVGDCVSVPFGKGDNKRTGYVVKITDKPDFAIEKIKSIDKIVCDNTGIEHDFISLASWMKETYGSTMIAALKTVLPVKKSVKPKERKKIVRNLGKEEIISLYAECVRKKQVAKARVLDELKSENIIPYDFVVSKLNVSPSTLSSLSRDGVITIESENYYRNPVKLEGTDDNEIILTDKQRSICDRINSKTGNYLIHGVTGSGKTQIYLNLIEHAIKEGKQCIMLIPEIALTYQTLMRFYKRFRDRVSVINSTLSYGERYDQCLRAQNGDIDVIIGPRSALFVPFKNLGLVIIDEEHESSYISEQNPRYHAVDTARELCRIKNATLVLGSATPSIESYYLSKTGGYELCQLNERYNGGELAKTQVVDMRTELRNGNRSMLSIPLQEAIADRLNKNEQVMLFLNRRGYSGFVSCRACGHVIKCPHCDVSLKRHNKGKLICHYCGYQTDDVKKCPECGSPYISGFKAGTQQVEETINKMFPKARVLRMDADTTKTKDSYENILSTFANKDADILIGTQMIVKGHDFPYVTLVGIIAADLSLNESDFKSGERTFQLITQACGRAGRGNYEGLSIIQTYNPEHYSIVHAASQDYEAFYKEELSYRKLCDYPPCGNMLQVTVSSRDEKRALGLATALKKKVINSVGVIGPSPAGILKVNDYYRYTIYLKGNNKDSIVKSRTLMEEYLESAPLETETVTFDVK